jgi:hypothetical protein
MALKLKADPTFVIPVAIPLPGGKEEKIKVEFIHKTRDELKAFQEERLDSSDAKTIMKIAKNWFEVEGEFNEENITEFLRNYHGAGLAIARTYIQELMQVRLGN